jgi:hypothetical protein
VASIKKLLFVIIIAVITQSCDPARVLMIKATGKPTVSVTIYADKKMLPHRWRNEKEKVVFKVSPNAEHKKRDSTLFFGFGGWSEDAIQTELTKHIDSIVIVNSTGKQILNTPTDISTYLIAHRYGFVNRIVKIEAK